MSSGNQMRRAALRGDGESLTCPGCGAPYEPACDYCGRGAWKTAGVGRRTDAGRWVAYNPSMIDAAALDCAPGMYEPVEVYDGARLTDALVYG